MGGVLLKEERMRRDEENRVGRCQDKVLRRGERGRNFAKNKNKHLKILFN